MNPKDTRPLITEKTLKMATLSGWYTFAVSKFARKEEISKFIGALYKVKPDNVRTVAMHGKERRTGKKSTIRTLSDWKKAYVHLPKGQTIEAFAITGQETEKK